MFDCNMLDEISQTAKQCYQKYTSEECYLVLNAYSYEEWTHDQYKKILGTRYFISASLTKVRNVPTVKDAVHSGSNYRQQSYIQAITISLII